MRIATMARTGTEQEQVQRLDHGPPAQPALGTLRVHYLDGTSRTKEMRPFLHQPGDWAEMYATVREAALAAQIESLDFSEMAFAVVQAAAGAYQIRPLESERGLPFLISGTDGRGEGVFATATNDALVGVVGGRLWVDLTKPDKRVDQQPVEFPFAP